MTLMNIKTCLSVVENNFHHILNKNNQISLVVFILFTSITYPNEPNTLCLLTLYIRQESAPFAKYFVRAKLSKILSDVASPVAAEHLLRSARTSSAPSLRFLPPLAIANEPNTLCLARLLRRRQESNLHAPKDNTLARWGNTILHHSSILNKCGSIVSYNGESFNYYIPLIASVFSRITFTTSPLCNTALAISSCTNSSFT